MIRPSRKHQDSGQDAGLTGLTGQTGGPYAWPGHYKGNKIFKTVQITSTMENSRMGEAKQKK